MYWNDATTIEQRRDVKWSIEPLSVFPTQDKTIYFFTISSSYVLKTISHLYGEFDWS